MLVVQLCLTLCHSMDYSPPGSSVHGILQARTLEWVAIAFSRGSSQLKDGTWFSFISGGFFSLCTTKVKVKVAQLCPTLQPHGRYSPWNSKGHNTGVCSHSLLQGIFPTQGSNPDLPHYRQILYKLSHQGSKIFVLVAHLCPTLWWLSW